MCLRMKSSVAYATDTPAERVVPRPILHRERLPRTDARGAKTHSSMITRLRGVACFSIAAVLLISATNGFLSHSGSLDHLQHECASVTKKIISRTHTAEHTIYDTDLSGVGGNEASRLGEDRDDRCLSQEGGFAALVRPSDNVQVFRRRHLSRVWGEVASGREQGLFHGRMTTVDDGQAGTAPSVIL